MVNGVLEGSFCSYWVRKHLFENSAC